MADPLNVSWEQAQHKSYEDLKREADAQKAKRENLQPLGLGKGQYANIFKVGDRLRPELALKTTMPESEVESGLGTGQVDISELIPAAAFKDLEHALAQANITAQAETAEGIREEIVYDADEAEVKAWLEPEGTKLVIAPPAVERTGTEPDSAAITAEERNGDGDASHD